MSLIWPFGEKATKSEPISNNDLDSVVQALQQKIGEIKQQSGVLLHTNLVDQLEQAANDAVVILRHRREITDGIVKPVAHELKVGAIFAWSGLIFSLFGLLTADISSDNTLLGRATKSFSIKFLPASTSPALDKLNEGVVVSSGSANARAEFADATSRLAAAMARESDGLPQMAELLKVLGEKQLADATDGRVRSLRFYIHLATVLHIKKDRILANRIAGTWSTLVKPDDPYAPLAQLYAAALAQPSLRVSMLSDLARSDAAQTLGDLEFVTPAGKVGLWAETLRDMQVSAKKEQFFATHAKIIFVNDSEKNINGLARRACDRLIHLEGFPSDSVESNPMRTSSRGADKLYLYFRSQSDQDAVGELLMKNFAGKYKADRSLLVHTQNIDIKRLFASNPRTAVVVRLPGEW